jgi:hypothetical protein
MVPRWIHSRVEVLKIPEQISLELMVSQLAAFWVQNYQLQSLLPMVLQPTSPWLIVSKRIVPELMIPGLIVPEIIALEKMVPDMIVKNLIFLQLVVLEVKVLEVIVPKLVVLKLVAPELTV